MSAHPNAAAKAGRVAHFFIGPDANGMSNLGSITIGKRGAGQSKEKEQTCRNQSQTGSTGRHKASSEKAGRRIMAQIDPAGLVSREAKGRRRSWQCG
jgi:hypothetical protein